MFIVHWFFSNVHAYVTANIAKLLKLNKGVFVYYGYQKCEEWFSALDPDGKSGESEVQALQTFINTYPITGIIIARIDFDVSTSL